MVFKKKYSIWFQLILGLLCGFLNMCGSKMAEGLSLPIFNDTLFTVLASFFGWTAGITSALGFYIFFCLFFHMGFFGFWFVFFCLSMVGDGARPFLVRLWQRMLPSKGWSCFCSLNAVSARAFLIFPRSISLVLWMVF